MEDLEEYMKRYSNEGDADKKLLKITDRPIEFVLFIAYILAGVISLDLNVVYNTSMFIFAITRFISKTDYSSYVYKYLRIKFDCLVRLNNTWDEKSKEALEKKKMQLDENIFQKRKMEIVYAIVLTLIYIAAPIANFSINHIISSVINTVLLWWYIIAEGKKNDAARKACNLANNLIANTEQLPVKEKLD